MGAVSREAARDRRCRPHTCGRGIRLRRDSWVSVMYAEELNSTKSSGFCQRRPETVSIPAVWKWVIFFLASREKKWLWVRFLRISCHSKGS
jgi:hypothetical protein